MIRHFPTKGNLEKRYVGRTDESILKINPSNLRFMVEGQDQKEMLSSIQNVFVSPLVRCRQTRDLVFPYKREQIISNFTECDFGEFEYKNYQDLNMDPEYIKWMETGELKHFPKGESLEMFKQRSVQGFLECMELCRTHKWNSVAMVVHGGTIMSIMESIMEPKMDFYHWHVKNGEGYCLTFDERSNKYAYSTIDLFGC